MKKQEKEEESKSKYNIPMVANSSEYNDAPSYYQPTVVPQNPLSFDQKNELAAFLEKITSAFATPWEIRDMFMKPVPSRIGQVRTTISRSKKGFDKLFPKYHLNLSEGTHAGKFLLAAKKNTGSATSHYTISTDSEKMEKSTAHYLGKVRSNFLGTEFVIFDTGANPKQTKNEDEVRS